METTLDIAAAISALFWPLAVLIILFLYRKEIPKIFDGIAGRVTKLGFGSFSMELAEVKAFSPKWSDSASALDLRHQATSFEVIDSTYRTFMTQLTGESQGEYAEVDLGEGDKWLTSRLYIMAIVFARMKGIRCFIFLETEAGVRKRYIGWADPEKIRWALARLCPWLEQAYAEAYATVYPQHQGTIVSDTGRLGWISDPANPEPGIELLREFLQRIQVPTAPAPHEEEDYVSVSSAPGTYEHARWVSGDLLESILGKECHTASIRTSELRAKKGEEKALTLLSMPGQFIGVVQDNQRFEYLIDRLRLLDQLALG